MRQVPSLEKSLSVKKYRTAICIVGLLSGSVLLRAQLQLSYTQYSTYGAGDGQSAMPVYITAGSDGALWFTLFATTPGENDRLGRVTTAGAVTEYAILTPKSRVAGIAAGPDGAVWYSLWLLDRSGGKIGRITTDGLVSEYPLPIPGSTPSSITTGSDGALWFTLQIAGQPSVFVDGGNMIGRITTAGVFTGYPIAGAQGIAAGPDGALWFTSDGGDQIARITTDGAIAIYPIAAARTGVAGNITTGPDGALWFAEPHDNGNFIGRITTAGVFTEYPIPSPAQFITMGPDGALWFSFVGSASSVGRITTTGTVTIYPLHAPQPVTLWSIITGPDGALWAADGAGWIGRIAISAVPNPAISQPSMPLGDVGVSYSAALSAFGGVPPYSRWTVSSGSLPQGFALDAATGAISGVTTTAGTFHVGVTVQDSTGATSAEQGASITINTVVPGISFVGSMPHLAAEENWTTTFTLVNKGGVQAAARLSLYGDLNSGTLPLPLTFPQQPAGNPVLAASLDRTLPAHAFLIVQTAGPQTPPVKIGSAQLSSTGAVDGFAIFHHVVTGQETVVPLETGGANMNGQEFEFDDTGGRVLGVALANPTAKDEIVGVNITDDNGAGIETDHLTIPANGHLSFVLPQRYPGTANTRGRIQVGVGENGQIGVLGMRFSGPNNALTTIPSLFPAAGGSVAHVATGNGWKTTFVLVNFNTTADGLALPSPIQLKFFDDNGKPLALPVGFPQTTSGTNQVTSSVQQTIAPSATLIIESAAPLSDSAPTVGSAQLTGNGAPSEGNGAVGGFVIYRYEPNGQEAAVPLENRTATGYLLAFDNTAGTATGVAVNSVSAQAADIPVVIRDDAGNTIATDTLHLAANGHSSFTLANDKYPMTANIRGTIEFDTPPGGNIGALAFRVPVGHTFTALPALAVSGTCVPTLLGCL